MNYTLSLLAAERERLMAIRYKKEKSGEDRSAEIKMYIEILQAELILMDYVKYVAGNPCLK